MSGFVAIENEASAGVFEQETNEALEAAFEGWQPAQGDLFDWLNKPWSRIGASFVGQASQMSRAAFKAFGEAVVGVPPIKAAPATVESVWTMVDSAGYSVPVGTKVTIEVSGDKAAGFVTVEELSVAPGATKGTALLQAVEAGAAGNGLSADPEPSNSFSYVESIELEGVTSGGVGEEEEDAYLDRLVDEFQTRSLSLIKGRDFEVDARSVAGIARAKCLEAYNIKEGKEEALAVSIVPIDSSGEASATPKKEELEVRQKAKLLSGINYYVGSPVYTTIKGKVKIEVEEGFDPPTTEASVEAWWAENFSPANCGRPTQGDSGSGWINRTKAYRLKTIGGIERIAGVGRVVTFEWAKNAEALGTAEELTLEGVVPLTKPGTLTVTTL